MKCDCCGGSDKDDKWRVCITFDNIGHVRFVCRTCAFHVMNYIDTRGGRDNEHARP